MHTELVSLEEFCIIKRLVANVARVALLVDIDHVFSKTIMLFHELLADRALELGVQLVIVGRHMFLDFPFGGELFPANLAAVLLCFVSVAHDASTRPALVERIMDFSYGHPTELASDGQFVVFHCLLVDHAAQLLVSVPQLSGFQYLAAEAARMHFFPLYVGQFEMPLDHVFHDEGLRTLRTLVDPSFVRVLVAVVVMLLGAETAGVNFVAARTILVRADVLPALFVFGSQPGDFLGHEIAFFKCFHFVTVVVFPVPDQWANI